MIIIASQLLLVKEVTHYGPLTDLQCPFRLALSLSPSKLVELKANKYAPMRHLGVTKLCGESYLPPVLPVGFMVSGG